MNEGLKEKELIKNDHSSKYSKEVRNDNTVDAESEFRVDFKPTVRKERVWVPSCDAEPSVLTRGSRVFIDTSVRLLCLLAELVLTKSVLCNAQSSQ